MKEESIMNEARARTIYSLARLFKFLLFENFRMHQILTLDSY